MRNKRLMQISISVSVRIQFDALIKIITRHTVFFNIYWHTVFPEEKPGRSLKEKNSTLKTVSNHQ